MEGLNLFVAQAVLLPFLFVCGWLAESAGRGVEFGEVLDGRRGCRGDHGGLPGMDWARGPSREFYIRKGRDDKQVLTFIDRRRLKFVPAKLNILKRVKLNLAQGKQQQSLPLHFERKYFLGADVAGEQRRIIGSEPKPSGSHSLK